MRKGAASGMLSIRTLLGASDASMSNLVKIELELSEAEWLELMEAIATKARIVREGAYGDFDPLDGFDPEDWALQLEALHRKISDIVEEHESRRTDLAL